MKIEIITKDKLIIILYRFCREDGPYRLIYELDFNLITEYGKFAD